MADQRCVDTDYERTTTKKQIKQNSNYDNQKQLTTSSSEALTCEEAEKTIQFFSNDLLLANSIYAKKMWKREKIVRNSFILTRVIELNGST